MAKRDLPNVYTEINDLSALIESDESLSVGITLRANRGPVNQAYAPADSADFLTTYTFSGKPGAKQDRTYFDILELLKVSSNIYVSRAAMNPLFGGLVVKKPQYDAEGNLIGVPRDYYQAIDAVEIATIKSIGEKSFVVAGNLVTEFVANEKLALKGEEYDAVVTVVIAELTEDGDTKVTVKEDLVVPPVAEEQPEAGEQQPEAGEDEEADVEGQSEVAEFPEIKVTRKGLLEPANYQFAENDLFMIAGIDPGEYNAEIGIIIENGKSVDEIIGVDGVGFKLTVVNKETMAPLEEYYASMNLAQKSMDGSNIFVSNVINGYSKYIQIITPDTEDIIEDVVPAFTGLNAALKNDVIFLGGGFDGDDDNESRAQASLAALEVFADKTVPVSLLVNGNNENITYQTKMLNICEERLDCFAFLATPKNIENYNLISQRVSSLVKYKKDEQGLGGLDKDILWKAAMYGPHVTVQDNYNSRKVVIGADSIACKQWIDVINKEGYPFAAAGPINGRLSNLTVDWKIGDESNEAKEFNDASMNVIVYENRQKFYYFNTQNTLQLANSAFRNVGAVLNVLGIKEYLTRALKDYIQMPITDSLMESIIRTIETYMDGCKSIGRVSDYYVSNNTTKLDISNNELHFLLTLAPAYYAQRIYLVMNVVNAAFDFAILQNA